MYFHSSDAKIFFSRHFTFKLLITSIKYVFLFILKTESELRRKQDTATGLKDGQEESNPLAELRLECRDVGETLTRSSKGG